MHELLRGAGLSAQDSARFLFAIDDYCIGAALNTEVDVEVNNRRTSSRLSPRRWKPAVPPTITR